jgi:hypothetical protein
MEAINNFMKGLIDYAGMYPPANLDLSTAFTKHLEYLNSEDEWMMDKFICSINSFEKFTNHDSDVSKQLHNFRSDRWVSFGLLLTGGKTSKEFLKTLDKDLEMIKGFVSEHFELIVTDNFEAKLPEDISGKNNSGACKKFLNDCSIIFNEHGLFGSKIFFEPPVNNDYEFVFEKLAYTMAESDKNGGNAGFKLRTGGITPELFPTTEQVAFALKSCKEHKLQFKATAGLHHPIRHYSDSVSTKMHGFMNVFGAGVLTYANSLSLKEITEIVNDENAGSFKFTEEEFRWNDITAGSGIISKARNEFVLSFGSCSFDDPREDLKKLNLL